MQFTTGQIVRTLPDKFGNFCVYRVTGTRPGLLSLEVTEINRHTGELIESNLIVHPDSLELYEAENTFGKVRIGDKIRCMGLEGEHTLLGFYESRTHHEIKAIVSYGPDESGSIPWTLEYVRRA